MTRPTPEKLERSRSFWDESAHWNLRRAILDGGEIEDPHESQAQFEAAGRQDTFHLCWFLHPQARVLDLGCSRGHAGNRHT